MTKTYRDWSTDQAYLFPPSPHDWLPEGDLVYFLLDTVATLDLTPIFAHYERELRGQPPFHPRMMVALLLYCYATGTRSSRRIMRRCHVDVACRVIVGEDIPDFRTISDFRKIHLARLEALFVEVLKLCALAGLAKVGTIALDGTKVKANASRHKAMSYDRMKAEEERLKEEIAKLLADAQAADEAEDIEHGPDRHGDELPDELARRQSRLAKIQEAKETAGGAGPGRGGRGGRPPPGRGEIAARRPRRPRRSPSPKDQINFTDPESRIMKASNKGWDQCGNAQAVTNEHQIILAADVTDQANDVRQAVPMVDQTRANLDAAGVKEAIKAALGDAGYYSETNAADLEQRGIDAVPGDRTAEASREGGVGPARADPQGPVGEAADGAEAADEEGSGDVREAEGDDRADLRPVEAGAGLPAVLAARSGVDARRVAADGDGAQPAEAVAAGQRWRWRGDRPRDRGRDRPRADRR